MRWRVGAVVRFFIKTPPHEDLNEVGKWTVSSASVL